MFVQRAEPPNRYHILWLLCEVPLRGYQISFTVFIKKCDWNGPVFYLFIPCHHNFIPVRCTCYVLPLFLTWSLFSAWCTSLLCSYFVLNKIQIDRYGSMFVETTKRHILIMCLRSRFTCIQTCLIKYQKLATIDKIVSYTLHWRHNDHDDVSNHQPHGCLLNRLFGRRSKKTSKLHVTALCAGNSPDRLIPRTKGQ